MVAGMGRVEATTGHEKRRRDPGDQPGWCLLSRENSYGYAWAPFLECASLPTASKLPSFHMTQTHKVIAGIKENIREEKPEPTPEFQELQNHR